MPEQSTGRLYEDFEVGDLYQSRIGRTVTDTDNVWFTCVTMNTNQVHFNEAFAEKGLYGRVLVNSTFTLALVMGLTVPDTSENAAANLGWEDVRLPSPVFVGDTLWAETEVLEKRESRSRPDVGIVSVRSRGINQRGEVAIEFRRTFMVYKRGAEAVTGMFPETSTEWGV